jgi:hypothetical protein
MRALAIILLLVNGLTAVAGGYMLMTDPTGGSMGMSPEWLSNSPFADFSFPGLILFSVNGLMNLMVLLLVIADLERYYYMIILAGLALVGWILVQVIMINRFSWLQATYLSIGVGLIYTGKQLYTRFVKER